MARTADTRTPSRSRSRPAGGSARRIAQRVRAGSAALPLWVKLVATMLGLLGSGLVVTGVAGVVPLRTYLLDRVDDRLTAAAGYLAQGDLVHASDALLASWAGPEATLMESYYLCEFSTSASDGDSSRMVTATGSRQSAPVLPTTDPAALADLAGRPFTAPAASTGHDWRILVVSLPDTGSTGGRQLLAVGISLDEVDATIDRLINIELGVGAAVLVALAALSYPLIRSSLRPLSRMEATAAAIAAGDLTRRVPALPARTEAGRLALALNGMLGQIEAAFREREAAAAQARAAEQRMRRFVSDASHELRTPLTAVRGFAELLRQQATAAATAAGPGGVAAATGPDAAGAPARRPAGAGADPRQAPRPVAGPAGAAPAVLETARIASDRIERAATRMSELVEDMLLLARLDQQRPLQSRPVDLAALAAEAVEEIAVVAPDHPVRLELPAGAADGALVVPGDDGRLRQVLGNLLDNAVRHTPAGTEVLLRLEAGADHALLEVADSGPGMAPQDAARVFERFYRVDAARDRSRGGAGLGLSIVEGIVTAHGGEVSVESTAGEGSRFRVRLPRRPGDRSGAAPGVAAVPADA